jgi:hypothetical protein
MYPVSVPSYFEVPFPMRNYCIGWVAPPPHASKSPSRKLGYSKRDTGLVTPVILPVLWLFMGQETTKKYIYLFLNIRYNEEFTRFTITA